MNPPTVVTPDNRIGGRRTTASSRSIVYLDPNGDSSSDPPYEPPLTPLSYTTITTVADVAAAAMSSAARSTNPRHSLRVPAGSSNNPPSAAEARKHPKPQLQKRGSWIINAEVAAPAGPGGPHADSTRTSFDMSMAADVPTPAFSPIDGRDSGDGRPVSIVVDRCESEQEGGGGTVHVDMEYGSNGEDGGQAADNSSFNVGWSTPPPASRRATHSFNNNNNRPHSYTSSKYDKYATQQQQQQQQQHGHHHTDPSEFAAGSMMSLAGGEGPDTWTSLLITDQRNSITQRNQAYASMAVVAALIAGISITFLVEVNFDFEADSQKQTALLQVVVMGSMVVAFLALYATMVLSSQYYLVTKALGGVTAMDVADEGDALANVNDFMKKTRTIRHLAVMAVVFTVPLFAVLIAAYGIAKTGLNGIGYASIGLGAFALLVFIHAIVSQQMAFSQPRSHPVADLDSIRVGAEADGYGGLSFSSSSFDRLETKEIKKPPAGSTSSDPENAKRKEAKQKMQKFDNAVSTFKLFG